MLLAEHMSEFHPAFSKVQWTKLLRTGQKKSNRCPQDALHDESSNLRHVGLPPRVCRSMVVQE